MSAPLSDVFNETEASAPMILVIGQTGAGKSHFCNRVLGPDVEEVKESAHLSSCTSEPALVEAKVDNATYLLVDTPGFNDTKKGFGRSDARILGEIAQTLIAQTTLGVKLRGILYLYDITAKRMTGETVRQFELIKRVCGEKNFANVLLVTTHWPERIEEQMRLHCAIREGDLRREFWSEMIRGGSTMCRFDDRHDTAKAIVRRLAGKSNITLALQSELASGLGLKKTTAFSFIVNARQREEEFLKRQLSNIGSAEQAENLEDNVRDQQAIEQQMKDEDRLHDNILHRVKGEINRMRTFAVLEGKRIRAPDVLRLIFKLTGLAMGAAQVGLASPPGSG